MIKGSHYEFTASDAQGGTIASIYQPTGLGLTDFWTNYLKALLWAYKLGHTVSKDHHFAVRSARPFTPNPQIVIGGISTNLSVKVTAIPAPFPLILNWDEFSPDFYFADKDNLMGHNWVTLLNPSRNEIFGIPRSFQQNTQSPRFPLYVNCLGVQGDWKFFSGNLFNLTSTSGQAIWKCTLIHWSKFIEKHLDYNEVEGLTPDLVKEMQNKYKWRQSLPSKYVNDMSRVAVMKEFEEITNITATNILSAIQDAQSLYIYAQPIKYWMENPRSSWSHQPTWSRYLVDVFANVIKHEVVLVDSVDKLHSLQSYTQIDDAEYKRILTRVDSEKWFADKQPFPA